MFAARRRRRAQNSLLLAGFGLGLYYLLAYLPMSHRAASLDQPLLDLWKELAQASTQVTVRSNEPHMPRLDDALQSLQDSRGLLEHSRRALADRIRPAPELEQRIKSTFQLIEFQNERQLATEQLWRLARQRKVQLDPKLAGGFPEVLRRKPSPRAALGPTASPPGCP